MKYVQVLYFSAFSLLTIKVHALAGDSSCIDIPTADRVSCLPLKNITREQCFAVQCCWDDKLELSNVPLCYFSKASVRYMLSSKNVSMFGIEAAFRVVSSSGFPRDVVESKMKISYCNNRLLRIKITDKGSERYEVPLSISEDCNSPSSPYTLYDVSLFDNSTLIVKRMSSGYVMFSVDLSKLIFADQFLQMTVSLPSHHIFGFGDHFGSLLRSTNWTKYTFFNRDEIPKENMNLYSSFPFYMIMEEDHSSHGVYFFNSNAMDVILQPSPAITFCSVGGIFDMFLFMGPSPDEVVQQFVKLIGYPAMPPYWSLGFHLCRLGYFTLNQTAKILERTINAGIPLDTQWNDIDYMDRYNDFTFDEQNFKGLPDFVHSLHKRGMHYALIIDPGISSAEPNGTYPPYDDGITMDIFIKNSTGKVLETKVWNKVSTVFPDFTHPLAKEYWKKQLSSFHSIVPFDGVWLDMNEPSNFLNGSFWGCPANASLEHPTYTPGIDALSTKTICMTSKHNISDHYNVHNIYGIYQTEATYNAMISIRGKRPFVLTRAGFPGIGRYAAMWNGDMISYWQHLKASIPSILGYSMVGIPMIGADICGFNDNTTVELCARWFELGAFYPFCRNHNSDENIAQDPVSLGPAVVQAAKLSLSVRYFLLPYLYTLLYRSHVYGETVARPLFFEYPHDPKSYIIDTQFLWGPALLVLPVLDPYERQVEAYLPQDLWYDFYSGELYKSFGQLFTFDAPLGKINVALRSGFVIPAQDPSSTTTMSRLNKFVLLIALDLHGQANGQLYWDDGESLNTFAKSTYNLIQFNVKRNGLTSSFLHRGFKTVMKLGEIRVFGVQQKPCNVSVNGASVDFVYNQKKQVLHVQNLNVNLLKRLLATW